MGGCIALLFMGGGYIFLLHKPLQRLEELYFIEIERIEALTVIQSRLFDPNELDNQLEQLQTFFSVHYQPRASFELVFLLETIADITMGVGLTLLSIVPGEVQLSQVFSSLSINIHALGTYQQFTQFMFELTQLRQIIALSKFELSRADVKDMEFSSSVNGGQQVVLNLILTAYDVNPDIS